MTTTELIELLKKHERGGATGRPREVMFEVDGRIIDTDGIEVTGSGDGLISELYLSLPSAQPERLTDDDFETIRIHLNAYKEKLCNQQRWEEAEEYQRIIDRFMAFASTQPKIEERKEESAQNVLKDDSVSRKAAIDAVNGVIADYIPTLYGRYEALPLEMAKAIKRLPTAEPTLYGYNIKHLAFVATVMEKEGVTAEYAARTFDDISRILKMVIDEAREKILAEVVKKGD